MPQSLMVSDCQKQKDTDINIWICKVGVFEFFMLCPEYICAILHVNLSSGFPL